MDENKKNCFKVLSTEDIRKLANNWTLASDVGLLAHLEQFSEKIFSQAQITQNNFNKLLLDYEELHSTVDNVTNQFLALQNCQFVENRVYDEETPVEETVQEKVINEDEKEKLLLMQYKKAVEIGIKLLDTHFQEVHLPPSSDSEEEDESVIGNSSLIWRPKNPYIGKRFPVLIGSAEWWSDDSVGLGCCEKNPDKEKVFLESESEEESVQEIEKKMSSSISSTENEKNISNNLDALDSSGGYIFGSDKIESFHKNSVDKFKNLGNSFIGKPKELKSNVDFKDEIVQKISSHKILEENENMTKQNVKIIEKVNLPFTQELAAKLQSVLDSSDLDKSENETSEHSKNEEKSFICKDLFDEHEDDGDLFSIKKTNSSDKNNLLFNDEKDDQLFCDSNNLLFESKTNVFDCDSATTTKIDLFSDSISQDDFNSSIKKKSILPDENLSKSLFADLDDDEILFKSYPINVGQSLSESINSKNNEKFEKLGSDGGSKDKIESICKNDIDDDLFTDPATIFTPQIKAKTKLENMEDLKGNNTFYSLGEESDLFSEVTDRTVTTKEYNGSESLNTFKKPEFLNSTLFTKDISGPSVKEKFSNEEKNEKYNKFVSNVEKDDDIADIKEDSFFGKKTTSLTKLASALKDDDNSLFLEKTGKPDTLSISSSRSSLFDDVSASKSRLASVFERDECSKLVDELFSETSDSLFDDDLFNRKNDNTSIKDVMIKKFKKVDKNSLFDDCEDTDTLFGSSSQSDGLFGNSVLGKEKNNVIEHPFTDENPQIKNSVKESILFNSAIDSLEAETNILFEKTLANEIQDETINFSRATEPINKSEYLIDGSKETKIKLSNNNKNNLNSGNEISASVDSQDVCVNKIENPELFSRKLLVENSRVKLKPPNSLNVKKDSVLPTDPSIGKSVGKLNISGDLKAKFESTLKPYFLDSKDKREIVDEARNQKRDSDTIFDKFFETETNLLKCPSKDRVKIPVKRRPQSRRARQEAIRNSETNLLTNANEESGTTETSLPESYSNGNLPLKKEILKNNSKSKFPSPALSNPLSPSTDEEDYFNVPELDTNFEKEDQRIFKGNLFQTESISNIDDSLVFDAAPVLSPLTPKIKNFSESKSIDEDFLFKSSKTNVKSKENSVFRDDYDDVGDDKDDDDFNMFRSDNTIHENTYSGFATQKFKAFSAIGALGKPLFDVSPTSEDLFGEKLSVAVTNLPNENIGKVPDKNKNITEKSNQQFVDPLGIMFNETK